MTSDETHENPGEACAPMDFLFFFLHTLTCTQQTHIETQTFTHTHTHTHTQQRCFSAPSPAAEIHG